VDLAIAIGQGAGLAVACGLVALLPLAVAALAALAGLLPGALPAADDPPVVAGSVALGLASVGLQTFVPPVARLPLAALGGGLVFELAAGDALPWAGLAIGALIGAASARVAGRVLDGARQGGGTAGGVAAITGGAAIILAGLALVPFVGYALLPVVGWFEVRLRRRKDTKYAGLRVLR
jgi:hypothetical protein